MRQLQDQHYHQYMQQLLHCSQNEQSLIGESEEEVNVQANNIPNGDVHHDEPESEEEDDGGEYFENCF